MMSLKLMQRVVLLSLLFMFALLAGGCGVRVFISDTRLRGPVPDPAVLAAQATVAAVVTATAAAPIPAEQQNVRAIIRELTNLVGEDLTAQNTFSGREAPRAGPLRGMRIEPGDTMRISAGRSQETALEADEYCVNQGEHCSTIWVYGRPGGKSQGAWYPLVIFDYEITQ